LPNTINTIEILKKTTKKQTRKIVGKCREENACIYAGILSLPQYTPRAAVARARGVPNMTSTSAMADFWNGFRGSEVNN
jgi:hypothetical protein